MNMKLEAATRQALARLQAHTDTADLDAIAELNEALAEQQAQREPSSVLVEGFSQVALGKLNDLCEKGYAVNGVAIATNTPDGKAEHGAVTVHGKVLWWPQQQAAEPVLWAIFTPGPDEYHPAPSKEVAEHMARKHNAALAEWYEKKSDKSGMDLPLESLRASVQPWPHSAEDHAEEIAVFDYAAWGLTLPAQQPVLVRDLAEILGVTVPEVCHELEECGGPRRSANMAVSGVEALAVAAQLKQAAEPIYQCQDSTGKWTDQAKHSYDYNVKHGSAVVRVVYTHPAPTQQAAEPNAVLVEGFGRVALRKLNDLHEKGYVINGVSIATISEAGETNRGAVTTGGMVLWWHQQPAQQAAEPVAWQAEHQSGEWVTRETPTLPSTGIFTGRIRALYTHPAPTHQPLTDEQIKALASALEAKGDTLRQFARAIEAAHGITSKKGGAA